MCSDCDDWARRGIERRDFRATKAGPEELPNGPKRKSKSKKWCKGKEGRAHRFEQVVWYSYKYTDSYGKERVRNTYRWVCQGCGKVEWSLPTYEVPKHEHHFCLTEIVDRNWRNYEEIFEKCCRCGSKGRSYKFWKKK